MVYLTAAAEAVVAGKCNGILIQVNKALTGTITVKDGTVTKAVITDPTVGSTHRDGKFYTSDRTPPSAITDITVTIDGSHGTAL